MTVKEKVLESVNSHGMLSGGETVIVGFSGGADSTVLLHSLHTLQKELDISLAAVHVNHQLRGEESERDLAFARTFCATLDVPFFEYTYDVRLLADTAGVGLEEMGRELRYQAFREVASRFERSRIATAHTLNDTTETVLLHLCRGCGATGLAGIPAVRGDIIRPLIMCTREEIEEYCRENNLPYMQDSSNNDVTYARNRVRNTVVPELRKINPALERAVSRMTSHMSEVNSFLQQETDRCKKLVETKESTVFLRKPFIDFHPLIQKMLLIQLLETVGIAADDLHLTSMLNCLVDRNTVSLPGGYLFTASGDYVRIFLPAKDPVAPIPISPEKTVKFCSNTYRFLVLSRKEYEQKLNISKFVFQNACDYDMISGVVTLRARREKDSFRPVGRGCTKTLKKLFNERDVFPELRNSIPILTDEIGILLVYGFGCDERVRITDSTNRVLLFEKVEE